MIQHCVRQAAYFGSRWFPLWDGRASGRAGVRIAVGLTRTSAESVLGQAMPLFCYTSAESGDVDEDKFLETTQKEMSLAFVSGQRHFSSGFRK